MESKQYATIQPVDHWRNQVEILKKYLEINFKKPQQSKTYDMQLKQF